MKTLAKIATAVSDVIGLSDDATMAKIKRFAALRYDFIASDSLWKDLLAVYTYSVAAGQTVVMMPPHVTDVVECKADNSGLIPIDQMFLFRSYAELWSELGTPSHWSELAPLATVGELTAAERMKFVSTSAADTSTVKIHGEDSTGQPLSELITLTGTTPSLTAGSFLTVYGVSKGTTTGTITMVGNNSAVTFTTLKPAENQRLYRRIRLHTIPAAAFTLLVLAKRAPAELENDTDATQLPAKCDQALIALTRADTQKWLRQYGKAQDEIAEGLALLKDAKTDETYQAAHSKRMTPGESLAAGCSPSDYE